MTKEPFVALDPNKPKCLRRAYERSSMLITSNQAFSEWDSIFGDNMMTVAAIDRLVHHSDIYQIQGESYRKKQAMKLNANTGQVN